MRGRRDSVRAACGRCASARRGRRVQQHLGIDDRSRGAPSSQAAGRRRTQRRPRPDRRSGRAVRGSRRLSRPRDAACRPRGVAAAATCAPRSPGRRPHPGSRGTASRSAVRRRRGVAAVPRPRSRRRRRGVHRRDAAARRPRERPAAGTPCSEAGGSVCNAPGAASSASATATAAADSRRAAPWRASDLRRRREERRRDRRRLRRRRCPQCADGRPARRPRDCQSKVCQGGVCKAPNCTDGAENGTETDVDCGGLLALRCASGKSCVRRAATARARSAPAASASRRGATTGCKNGTETDVDCGGACADCPVAPTALAATGATARDVLSRATSAARRPRRPRPAAGKSGSRARHLRPDGGLRRLHRRRDCQSEHLCVCTPEGRRRHLRAASAAPAQNNCGHAGRLRSRAPRRRRAGSRQHDGRRGAAAAAPARTALENGAETDVDCGGSCPGCGAGAACVTTADCASGLTCDASVCGPWLGARRGLGLTIGPVTTL